MSRRRNSPSTDHAHDRELRLSHVADIRLPTVAQTAENPSDPPIRASTAAAGGRGKRAAKTEPPHDLQPLPSRQRGRLSGRENRPRRLLSIRDVAEILNTSEKTVYRLIDKGNGELRAIRIGGVWRIDPADLQDFIRDRRSP
jgi:excisionase family DNA binding protein